MTHETVLQLIVEATEGALTNQERNARALALKEEEGAIRDALFNWAADKVRRGVAAGLPQWYKEELLKQQFAAPDSQE